jgi:hypothetical protein
MSAIEILGIFLFLIFVVACIGMIVFLATWVYKDAKARGLNAPLWTIVVIIAGQRLIGLLIYLFVGRRETKITCPECAEKTSMQAKFCDKCGKPVNKDLVAKPKSEKKWLIALLVAFIVALITGIGTMGIVFKVGYEGRLPGNVSIGKMEKRFGDQWKVSVMRSNETLNKTVTIKSGDPKTLYFDGSCEDGSMVLVITLDDTTLTYEISEQSGEVTVNLDNYQTDSFRLTLINNNVKNGKFNSSWE